RGYSERGKEIFGYHHSLQTLSKVTLLNQAWTDPIDGEHVLEHRISFAIVGKVRHRMRPSLRMNRRPKDSDQPFRILVRQVAKQICVQHTEHCRIGADAKRHGRNRYDCESWSPPK